MDANKIIKGGLTVAILQLLQNNGRMYGYEISAAISHASRDKIKITEAALYPALHKLEAAGFVQVETEVIEGRTRKYYKLNRSGKKEAAQQLAVMLESFAALQKVFRYKIN